MTFPATANVVVHLGAIPVFADVDPRTRSLSPDTLSVVLAEGQRCVMPVLLGGFPIDLIAIKAMAAGAGASLLVDAAHAIETRLGADTIGGIGDATAYSFYATKNITTGEGGMLTTGSQEIADRVRRLTLHGLSADAWQRYSGKTTGNYEVVEPGFKYNMTDIQAALGLGQLARIERSWLRRSEIWQRYNEAFRDLPLDLPPTPDPALGRSAYHLYSPLLDTARVPFDRDALRSKLREHGVGTGVHFTALHLHAYYRERFGYRPGQFPVAEDIGTRTFSLPLSGSLDEGQVDRVIDAVRSVLGPFA